MNCHEYQGLVSSQMEGDLSPAQVIEAEAHRGACSRCAGIFNDLRTIVTEVQRLPAFEPSDRIWTRLRAECEAEHLIKTTSPGISRWARLFDVSERPRMAMATATLVIVLMIASVWLYRSSKIPAPSPGTSQETQVTNEVRLAEQHYLQAIESLEKISRSRMAQMDPSVKGVLEDNLATIDYYIDKCRETVKNEPSNALAQRYLLEAYRKKVDLLASIVHSDVL